MANFWDEEVVDREAERNAVKLDWDPDTGRLAKAAVLETKRQRRGTRQQADFLKGPIPMAWLGQACQLPGKAVNVAVALWYVRGFKRPEPFKLKRETLARFGVARQASYYQALAELEAAGLVRVIRKPGQALAVTVILPAGRKSKPPTKPVKVSLNRGSYHESVP